MQGLQRWTGSGQTPGWTFRLFGYPITVRLSFLLMALVIGGGDPDDYGRFGILFGVVTFSLLWHEFGHALAFRIYGFKSRIELWAFGGLTWPESTSYRPEDRPGRDIVISLAGPAAGLLLGGVVYLVDSGTESMSPYLRLALYDAQWMNLGWTLINLVPVLPLDGGRAFSSLLRGIFRGREGAAAKYVSLFVGSAFATVNLLRGNQGLGIGAASLVLYNLQSLIPLRTPAPAGGQSKRVPATWVREALAAMASGDRSRALRTARSKLEKPDDRQNEMAAAFLVASVHLLEQRDEEAAAIADRYLADVVLTPVLPPDVVAAAGGEERAVEMWRRAFDKHPSQPVGALLTQALIETKRLDDATALLFDPRLHPVDVLTGRRVQLALLQDGRSMDAVELGRRLLEDRDGDAVTEYNIACAYARLHRHDEALEWLDRAVESGFKQGEHLDNDPDLAGLRGRVAYARIREKASA